MAILHATLVGAGQEYRLGDGDRVNISVYEQPDLSVVARLSQDDGTISYPLLGQVKLGGSDAGRGWSKDCEAPQKGGFLKFPEVTVTVKDFLSQKIPIMGQVKRPGEYPLTGESRVVDLIAQAGGLNAEPADVIVVVKNQKGKQVKHEIGMLKFYGGDMSQNIEVVEGDFILVPKMDTFYIHDDVKRPGSYRLERGMTVMLALSEGGGLTDRGSLSRMQVTRSKPDGGRRRWTSS